MKTSTVDQYLIQGCMRCSLGNTPDCKVHTWAQELKLLRDIISETELNEEVKWSQPCYTYNDKNVLIMAAFKNYAFISFFKGSLLEDKAGLLHSPGENSQAARQFRFTSADQVVKLEPMIKAYIHEAIELEKAGKKVPFKKDTHHEIPDELQDKFTDDPAFEQAFLSLTPGRQRGYILHFSGAKQSATRISRIEKQMDRIFEGKGMHDR